MRPILFSTEMVKAILDGRKTCTRRVVKPQPVCGGINITFTPHDDDFFLSEETHRLRCRVCGNYPEYSREGSNILHHWEPPYRPGDILYVRETWYYEAMCEGGAYDPEPDLPSGRQSWRYVYKASNPDYPIYPGHWHPSIHMPKEAARIFLRVMDVRVERLRDMSDEDARKEGVLESAERLQHTCDILAICGDSVDAFARVWDSTVKKADLSRFGWEANPWVWVIEFEQISKEEV